MKVLHLTSYTVNVSYESFMDQHEQLAYGFFGFSNGLLASQEFQAFQRIPPTTRSQSHRCLAPLGWTADGGEEPRQRDGGTRARHFAPAEEAVRENLRLKPRINLVSAAGGSGETGVCREQIPLMNLGGSLGCSCDASSCSCFLLLLCCLKEIFYRWWKLFKLIVSHHLSLLRIRFCIFLFRIFIDITHYMLVYRHIFKWHENFLLSNNPWLPRRPAPVTDKV